MTEPAEKPHHEPTQQAQGAPPAPVPPPIVWTGEEPVTRPKAVQTGLEIMAGRSHDWDSAALFMGPTDPAPRKSAKQRQIEAQNLSLF